jgi:hypothetical protein
MRALRMVVMFVSMAAAKFAVTTHYISTFFRRTLSAHPL